tara:strand:- start:2005 stop:2667 length:663 start_codon:yes stop_codon:yes gene_type:complete
MKKNHTEHANEIQPNHHDQHIKDAIASVEPPTWLKDSILEQAKPKTANILHPRFKLLAIAATLIVCFFSAFTFLSMKGNTQLKNSDDFRDAAATYVANGKFLLDYKTSSLDSIEGWLKERIAPSFTDLPELLKAQTPIGCKELVWQGTPVTLVCFHREDGKIVHLFIGNRTAETEKLFTEVTNIRRVHELETGGWLSDQHVYLLTGSEPSVSITSYLEST